MISTAGIPPKSLLAVLAVATLLGWHYAFLQDDAYISFTYARNFAEGNGLVWYPGLKEFGYTNFLFTLLIGILMKIGLSAEAASYAVSFPAYLGAIYLTFGMARLLSPRPAVAVVVSLALATHLTFSAYATGGMETSLQTFLVLGVYHQLLRWRQDERTTLRYLGLFSALALLTRLDSAILLAPAYMFLLRQDSKAMLRAALLPAAAAVTLMGFCHAYYGQALPATFAAKITSNAGQGVVNAAILFAVGANYVWDYIRAQYLIPLALFMWWVLIVRKQDRALAVWQERQLLLAPVGFWLVYIMFIGGDFMEYRLMMPVLPFFYLTIVKDIIGHWRGNPSLGVWVLMIIVFLGNSAQRDYMRAGYNGSGVESIRQLRYWVMGKDRYWVNTGKALKRLFYTRDLERNVIIASTNVGAIAYYSRLKTIDQYGLNTRAVLENNGEFNVRRFPGHRIKATLEYLEQAGVHLLIDRPIYLEKRNDGYYCLPQPLQADHKEIAGINPVLIRVSGQHYLLAHYLRRHPRVQRLIGNGIIIPYSEVASEVHCGPGFETGSLYNQIMSLDRR